MKVMFDDGRGNHFHVQGVWVTSINGVMSLEAFARKEDILPSIKFSNHRLEGIEFAVTRDESIYYNVSAVRLGKVTLYESTFLMLHTEVAHL